MLDGDARLVRDHTAAPDVERRERIPAAGREGLDRLVSGFRVGFSGARYIVAGSAEFPLLFPLAGDPAGIIRLAIGEVSKCG